MKRILSLTIALAMLLTVAVFPAAALEIGVYGENSQSGVVATELTTANAKPVGRNNPANPFVFAWHASGVEFDVTGSTVAGLRISSWSAGTHWVKYLHVTINGEDVTLNGSHITETYDYSENNAEWLAANPQPERNAFTTKKGTSDYIFATDLNPNKTYTVKVTLNQENWGQYWQSAVKMTHALTSEGATVSRTADRDRKIIFYGDSITSAGSIGGVHNSWHQLTAKAFGADSQVLSASGGMFYPYPSVTSNQFCVSRDWNLCSWNLTPYTEGTSAATNTPDIADADGDGNNDLYETDPNNLNFDADLIVINIGTNDEGSLWNDATKVESQALFTTAFTSFVDGVREYYPDATIVLSYGLMRFVSAMQPFYEGLVSDYIAAHPEMGNNAAGNPKLTTFFYTRSAVLLNDNHPDKNGHASGAKELTAFLSDYMNWEEKGLTIYPDNNGVVTEFPYVEYEEGKLPLGFTANGNFVKIGDNIGGKTEIVQSSISLAEGALDGFVDTDGNAKDDNPVAADAKYQNGFYIQGAQVRIPDGTKPSGLRFIVVNNTDIEAKIKAEVGEDANFKRGLVVIAGTKYKGGDLTVGMAGSSNVVANKIYRSKTTLEANYDKYTACVTNITEPNFETLIYVRPYFSYTDASGVEHTYYGEQYACTLYSAANLAYSSPLESEETKTYLYDNIISKCFGDNDVKPEF